MKIGLTYELKNHGGPKPTWRKSNALWYIGKGIKEPIRRSIRILSNKETKKVIFK